MDALLIIDMQVACFNDVDQASHQHVIHNLNRLSPHFRQQQLPVIFVQHYGGSFDFAINSPGWELVSQLDVHSSDWRVDKSCCDAYQGTNLSYLLEHLGVSRVWIGGCASDFCVDSTVKGSLTQRLDVVVLSDGHTAFDRPYANATTLIRHYNWVWANLITGANRISVITTDEALQIAKRLADHKLSPIA